MKKWSFIGMLILCLLFAGNASATSKKLQMALWLENLATQLSKLHSEMERASDIWDDKGYASGGTNPIVDGDITGHDITAAQLALMITLINNFDKFWTNQVPTQNTYGDTIGALAENE